MIERHGLAVDDLLDAFIMEKALPDTGIRPEAFWQGFSGLIRELTPRNQALLQKRDQLQARIDAWWKAHPDANIAAQKAFLTEIGYLIPEGPELTIDTAGIDPEIATIAGPQLVVPITNARYALNAANARWGSLYDGLYGTDVMGLPLPSGGYDRGRGARVVARARVFLDEAFPIEGT